MPRGSSLPSEVFKAVLDSAARQLHIASSEASAFKAMLIKVHRCRFSNVIRR